MRVFERLDAFGPRRLARCRTANFERPDRSHRWFHERAQGGGTLVERIGRKLERQPHGGRPGTLRLSPNWFHEPALQGGTLVERIGRKLERQPHGCRPGTLRLSPNWFHEPALQGGTLVERIGRKLERQPL